MSAASLKFRVRDLGTYVNVSISANEVDRFRRQWPGCGLPDHGITFQFRRSNGDLVDLWGAGRYDGPDLLALSQDASNAAAEKLHEPALAR